MNERMIELANRANEDVGYTFKLEDANQIHTLMEKFAELIVLDCIEIVKEDMYSGIGHHSQFSLGSDTALEMAVANIKEKFGVE